MKDIIMFFFIILLLLLLTSSSSSSASSSSSSSSVHQLLLPIIINNDDQVATLMINEKIDAEIVAHKAVVDQMQLLKQQLIILSSSSSSSSDNNNNNNTTSNSSAAAAAAAASKIIIRNVIEQTDQVKQAEMQLDEKRQSMYFILQNLIKEMNLLMANLSSISTEATSTNSTDNNNNNAKIFFDMAMQQQSKEQWQEAFDSLIKAWAAYNDSIMITNNNNNNNNNNNMVELIYIFEWLEYLAFKLGNIDKALALCKQALVSLPDMNDFHRQRFETSVNFYQQKLIASQQADNINKKQNDRDNNNSSSSSSSSVDSWDHQRFCSNKEKVMTMPPSNNNNNNNHHAGLFYCRLTDRNRHALLLLSPLKEEILSHQPPIVFFHDIVLPKEIQLFQELTRQKFTSAKILSHSTQTTEVHESTRRAQVAWLNTARFPALTKRLEAITGLDPYDYHHYLPSSSSSSSSSSPQHQADDDMSHIIMNMNGAAESYQVSRYDVGGHYIPHYDMLFQSADADVDYRGDRIATLLIYLNQVEAGGGATVFTQLGVRQLPEAGGALFWYNLHRNESYDMRTLHAACPVEAGEKWVVNKWFRIRGQLNKRPCAIDPLQDFTID